jgi:hypothetical protein
MELLNRSWLWIGLPLAIACGPPAHELPELMHAPEDPQCPPLTGTYRATFTLQGSEGTCDSAKQESHDPMEFDAEGRFVSPVKDVIDCETLQVGCQLAIRCTSSALKSRAALDGMVEPSGDAFSGFSVVEGTYRGCKQVTYAVKAVRRTLD